MLTPDLAARYTESGTALVSRNEEWRTEIGDTKQPDFYPQVKLIRWSNESNFSVRLAGAASGVVSYDRAAIRWAAPSGVEAWFYDKGFRDGGGFEFEVWLPSKPVSNVIEFSLQHKGLKFEFQPSLADEYPAGLPAGIEASRPANVVGSYAVYHASRQNGRYTTGKAFHLYRPWAEDRNGARVWCRLAIDAVGNRLTITVPQAFLDAAVYPVLIDPTLGYTTVGGSDVGLNASIVMGIGATGTTGFAMTEGGTATQIQMYATSNFGGGGGAAPTTLGIYSEGTDYPGSLLADSSEITINSASGVFAWHSAAISGSLTNGAEYWLAQNHSNIGAGEFKMKYDSVTDAMKWKDSTYSASALETPFPSAANVFSGKVSIYVDYTASGGGSLFVNLAGSGGLAGTGGLAGIGGGLVG